MLYCWSDHSAGYGHGILLERDDFDVTTLESMPPFELQLYLDPEVVSWLDENIGVGAWQFRSGRVRFKTKEDALAFMLAWGK